MKLEVLAQSVPRRSAPGKGGGAHGGELPSVIGELPVALIPPAPPDLRASVAATQAVNDDGSDRARTLQRDSIGFRTAMRILNKWRVRGDQAARLLGLSRRTMYQWQSYVSDGGLLREPLGVDMLDRISYILGIWKATVILLPSEEAAIKYLRAPNDAPMFQGRPPLERMLGGHMTDLAAVRMWFDAWRGG